MGDRGLATSKPKILLERDSHNPHYRWTAQRQLETSASKDTGMYIQQLEIVPKLQESGQKQLLVDISGDSRGRGINE